MQKIANYLLLADDDMDDRFIFIQAFQQQYPSVSMSAVEDGEELLSFLENCEALPGLILVDYKMPNLSGPEVLSRLSQKPAYSPIKKLVWSTSNRPKDREACLRLGAAGYFEKPSSSQELNSLLERIYQFLTEETGNRL